MSNSLISQTIEFGSLELALYSGDITPLQLLNYLIATPPSVETMRAYLTLCDKEKQDSHYMENGSHFLIFKGAKDYILPAIGEGLNLAISAEKVEEFNVFSTCMLATALGDKLPGLQLDQANAARYRTAKEMRCIPRAREDTKLKGAALQCRLVEEDEFDEIDLNQPYVRGLILSRMLYLQRHAPDYYEQIYILHVEPSVRAMSETNSDSPEVEMLVREVERVLNRLSENRDSCEIKLPEETSGHLPDTAEQKK